MLLSGHRTCDLRCNLVPAKAVISLAGKVTVGLVESNGSLPPVLWLISPAGWLPRKIVNKSCQISTDKEPSLWHWGMESIVNFDFLLGTWQLTALLCYCTQLNQSPQASIISWHVFLWIKFLDLLVWACVRVVLIFSNELRHCQYCG